MPIVVDIIWGDGGESVLILGWTTIVQSTLMMISAEVIESVYLLLQLLRSTLTWKIKLSSPKVLLCWNYSLFNTKHKKVDHMKFFKSLLSLMYMCVPINRFVNPFTLQNNLLIAFSLCHSSAEDKQVA